MPNSPPCGIASPLRASDTSFSYATAEIYYSIYILRLANVSLASLCCSSPPRLDPHPHPPLPPPGPRPQNYCRSTLLRSCCRVCRPPSTRPLSHRRCCVGCTATLADAAVAGANQRHALLLTACHVRCPPTPRPCLPPLNLHSASRLLNLALTAKSLHARLFWRGFSASRFAHISRRSFVAFGHSQQFHGAHSHRLSQSITASQLSHVTYLLLGRVKHVYKIYSSKPRTAARCFDCSC